MHGPIGQPAPFVIAASSASGVTRASSRTRTQSLRSGMRTRLTTKPGVSWQGTATFPRRSTTSSAVATASSDESSARTTSTSGISGAGLKKCIPTTRSGRGGRRGDLGHGERGGVRGEDGVPPAEALELDEQRALRLELLDDRLDHEVAVDELGHLGRRPQPPERGVARVLRELALLDLAREEVPDALGRGLAQLVADLPPDDVEAGLDRDLRDPGPHRPETDDTDPPYVHGRRIYREGRARPACLGGGAELARAEPEQLGDVERDAERVGDHGAARRGSGRQKVTVDLRHDERHIGKTTFGEGLEPVERRAVVGVGSVG